MHVKAVQYVQNWLLSAMCTESSLMQSNSAFANCGTVPMGHVDRIDETPLDKKYSHDKKYHCHMNFDGVIRWGLHNTYMYMYSDLQFKVKGKLIHAKKKFFLDKENVCISMSISVE